MQISDLKIILVDDDLSVRKSVWFLLTAVGVSKNNIREAGNGAEALRLLEEEDADLVWSDINMPVMDGVQMTATIREKEKDSGKQTWVTLTSGAEFNEKARKVGANALLQKPFDLNTIKTTLNDALRYMTSPVPSPSTSISAPEVHP